MSASFGAVMRGSIDRLQSAAGAALLGVLFLISFLSTAADHSQGGIGEGVDFEELRSEMLAEAETEDQREFINTFVDNVVDFVDQLTAAQTVFDIGLSDTAASTIGLLIWIPLAIVAIGGLKALAEERQQFTTEAFSNVAWKLVNIIGGAILLGIAALVGGIVLVIVSIILAIIPLVGWLIALLLWLIVPFLVGALLFYWLPAIAVDNENAIEALSTSYQLGRSNLLSTVGIVLTYGILQFVSFVLFLWLVFNAPASTAAVTNLVFGVVITTLVLAWMATGYDLAKDAHERAVQGPEDEAWGGGGEQRLGDNPGAPGGAADETWDRGGRGSGDTDETWDSSGTRSDTGGESWDQGGNAGSDSSDDAWGAGGDGADDNQ